MPARRTTAVAIALLAAAALASAQEPDAAKIYTKTCALCHGPEGQPNEMFAKMGVRSFKDKFSPTWEPRYLATSGLTPLAALTNVAALVGGGLKGVFAK